MYDMIYDFMGSRPIFKPPHVWDMIDDGDKNYKSTSGQTPKDIQFQWWQLNDSRNQNMQLPTTLTMWDAR
jgi:hypothetical protein